MKKPAGKIPEIDPELFTYELYEMNFGDRLGLYNHLYPEVFEFAKTVGVALMCEDENGERFWFHALDKTAEALEIIHKL